MLKLIIQNFSTIVVSGGLLGVLVLIILKMKKQNKGKAFSCGGNCGSCTGSSICQSDKT
jgi:hypothetical protein